MFFFVYRYVYQFKNLCIGASTFKNSFVSTYCCLSYTCGECIGSESGTFHALDFNKKAYRIGLLHQSDQYAVSYLSFILYTHINQVATFIIYFDVIAMALKSISVVNPRTIQIFGLCIQAAYVYVLLHSTSF